MEDKVRKTIEDNSLIKEGDHIVLGLSGGPDSLSLLYVLLGLKDELGFDITCVHVNHMLRPGDAEKDASFCKEVCEKEGIGYREFTFDCAAIAKERNVTPEEAGRQIRYEAFDSVCDEIGANAKIAVAQNANDQYETMLFRLIRGTGPDGLAAMRYERKSEKGYPVIRPLLDVKREEITRFCQARNLDPRIDHTNSETEYTRNKLRLALIPKIEREYNPGFSDALARLGKLLSEDRDYLDSQSEKALLSIRSEEGADCKGLDDLPASLKGRVIKKLAKEAGLTEDMGMAHIEAVKELVKKTEGTSYADLPNGYRARVSYGVLVIENCNKEGVYGGTEDNSLNKVVKASFDADALTEAFGTDEIEIRTRRPGDYIYLAAGKKKIKDLFIDLKIPKDKRDDIKMACIGSEALLVAGYRYSVRYRVNAGTRKSVDVEITV